MRTDLEKSKDRIQICSGRGLDKLAHIDFGMYRRDETDSEFRIRLELRAELRAELLFLRDAVLPASGITWLPPSPICECGSEKTRTPGHSHWCPKFEG